MELFIKICIALQIINTIIMGVGFILYVSEIKSKREFLVCLLAVFFFPITLYTLLGMFINYFMKLE